MTQPPAETTPLLPICTRPVQIRPDPTMWNNDGAARQWIAAIIRRHTPDQSGQQTAP